MLSLAYNQGPALPETPDSSSVAILIDGENMSPTWAGRILAAAGGIGEVTICQVYGKVPIRMGMSRHSGTWHPRGAWYDRAAYYQFAMMDDVPTEAGKNAVDIALTVGAMQLLSAGIRRFCLAASDSDYVALVRALHKAGSIVLGIGDLQTSRTLQDACTQFLTTCSLPSPVPWSNLWELVLQPHVIFGQHYMKRRVGGTGELYPLNGLDFELTQEEAYIEYCHGK